MRPLSIARLVTLAALALPGCKDKTEAAPAADSAAPSAPSAKATAAAAPPADVSCDAVIANVSKMTKVDEDGKKLFGAICEGESQTVRQCMVAAKNMKDFDACDPHPLKKPDAKSEAPALTAADLVEVDLGSADPKWKGWSAKGPKDAKVLADGVHGARIAGANVMTFDLAFEHGKAKLADKKKGIVAGGKAMGPDVKIAFVTDTADELVWTTEVSGSKIWRATWNIKASGKPANCSTGTIGAASEAQLALFKTSCESLHKK